MNVAVALYHMYEQSKGKKCSSQLGMKIKLIQLAVHLILREKRNNIGDSCFSALMENCVFSALMENRVFKHYPWF